MNEKIVAKLVDRTDENIPIENKVLQFKNKDSIKLHHTYIKNTHTKKKRKWEERFKLFKKRNSQEMKVISRQKKKNIFKDKI